MKSLQPPTAVHYPPLPSTEASPNRRLISLNGDWRYMPQIPADFPLAPLPPKARMYRVPGEFVMQGLAFNPSIPAAVERGFSLPQEWSGQRVRLRFEAVYAACVIWVNGVQVGEHQGGYTPFDLDITNCVRPGAGNRLSLRVSNNSLADEIGCGSDYAEHPLAGITRKVSMYALSSVYLQRLDYETVPTSQPDNWLLRVLFEVRNSGIMDTDQASLSFNLRDPAGRRVPILAQVTAPLMKAGSVWEHSAEFSVAGVQRWDPEHPNLYTFETKLSTDGEEHRARLRVGFRQVKIRERQLLVNGRPIKLRGVNRHETHPLHGRATPPEIAHWDAELFKQANVNFVRTSHYPPLLEFVESCNELGLFVEVEAPASAAFGMWDDNKPKWEELPAEQQAAATAYLIRVTLEMIEFYRSHPSVILWSMGNESVWTPAFEAATQAAQAADTTRPSFFNNWEPVAEALGEITSVHYPKAGNIGENASLSLPVLFDEYCHLPVYRRSETFTDPGVHDLWGEILLRQWEDIYALPNSLGGSIWSGIDDFFIVPEAGGARQRGYGSWGLLDGWRRPKPEFWHVRKVYSPVRIPVRELNISAETREVQLPIQNRSDFTPLSELSLTWRLGAELGAIETNLPPHTEGMISLLLPPFEALEDDLIMEVRQRDTGRVLDTHLIHLEHEAQLAHSLPAPTPLLATETAYWLTTPAACWQVSRQTGLASALGRDDRAILLSGPVLALTPYEVGHPKFFTNFASQARDDIADRLCSGWQVEQMEPAPNNPAWLNVHGQYREAAGHFQLWAEGDTVSIRYEFEIRQAIRAWQIGLAFALNPAYNELSWRRIGLWNDYPADHIGRPVGSTRAFRDERLVDLPLGTPPAWTWARDQTEAGTNDFRSTKYRILTATLSAPDGTRFRVISDGSQHVRVGAAGEMIRLFILDHADIGGEPFQQGYYAAPKELTEGDIVRGTMRLQILESIREEAEIRD